MYLIKLPDDMIRGLYKLREELKKEGVKTSVAELVRSAVKEKLLEKTLGEKFLCKHAIPKPICEFCRQAKYEKTH
jgi:hypothetical protein